MNTKQLETAAKALGVTPTVAKGFRRQIIAERLLAEMGRFTTAQLNALPDTEAGREVAWLVTLARQEAL